MTTFRKGPPTVSQITCKTCGVLKPRTEFPVVDNGRRIGGHCNKCQAWIDEQRQGSKELAEKLLAIVDRHSLSYSAGTKALMEGKFK